MNKHLIIALAILAVILGGSVVYEKFKTRSDFLRALLPDAKKLEELTGIKAAVTLTQAGLESGAGSELAVKYKNLFGIKVGSSWTGGSVNMTTKEEVAGYKVTIKDNFRVYPTWLDSMKDWASLLARLYPDAYAAAKKGDIKAFAEGLKHGKAGAYATDSRYPQLLAQVWQSIEGTIA